MTCLGERQKGPLRENIMPSSEASVEQNLAAAIERAECAVARAEASERRVKCAEELAEKERQRADRATAQMLSFSIETEAAKANANDLTLKLSRAEVEASKVRGLEGKMREREDELAAMSACMERVIHPAQDAVREARMLRQVVRALRSILENTEDVQYWRDKYDLLHRQTEAHRRVADIDAQEKGHTIRELERLLSHHQKLTEDRIASSERQIASMRDSYYAVAGWVAPGERDASN